MNETSVATWLILAQGDSIPFWLPLLAIGVLFYFMLIRPERRKQAEQKNMLSAVKKNDRVVTIGGIKGTVVSVRKETDDVTIKTDDAGNTKLRMTLASISRIERDEKQSAEDVRT